MNQSKMSHSPIRLLLADDHAVVREGLKALLSSPRFNIVVVGDAADGDEAVEQARRLEPDVILMDLQMPRMSGIEAIAAIKQENPQACILVLTSFHEFQMAKEAVQAGAMGFLLKESTPDDLVHAIRTVYRGKFLLPADLADDLLRSLAAEPVERPLEETLTRRERAILDGIVRGLPNKDIADELHISTNTVRSHVRTVLTKLGVSNRTQAAMYAVQQGLLEEN